jgi:hypothetical protein
LAGLLCLRAAGDATPSFAREIQPILSNKCFMPAMGPDEKTRKGKLRLDIEARRARVLGGPAWRNSVARIARTDPEERMPPAETGKSLTARPRSQSSRRGSPRARSTRQHWAFVAPQRHLRRRRCAMAAWPRNDIDRFVLVKLEAQNVTPSRRGRPRDTAAPSRALDLTGLPPTPQEVGGFLADAAPGAYERAVDACSPRRTSASVGAATGSTPRTTPIQTATASTRRAVHLALPRLGDQRRQPDLPFDQFVIEQLAGDLLPDATVAQKDRHGLPPQHDDQ